MTAAKLKVLARWFGRALVWGLAALCAIQLLLAFFGIPDGIVAWLVGDGEPTVEEVDVIVVLGGGGIPSEAGLLRTYVGAELARSFTNASVIVSLPAGEDIENSHVAKMRDELVMRGVARERVLLEAKARNTHEEAVEVARMLGPEGLADLRLVVVTSPMHIRRSLMCFRHEGFTAAGVLPAHSADVDGDAGSHTGLRYGIWNRLSGTFKVLRELVAIAYYRFKGWV